MAIDPESHPGVREALAVPEFRNLFIASFISNAGRWMQFAALGVLSWEMTESSAFLGYIIFAQLAPLAFLSLLGGSLADTADRRKLLMSTQMWQLIWTFALAAVLLDDTISEAVLLGLVFTVGLGQGLYAPAFTSVLPLVAGEENLPAAIALNSIQLNSARVIGPAIGGFLVTRFGFAEVFAINAFTYLVVVLALATLRLPNAEPTNRTMGERLFGGIHIVRRAPQVGRPILLMALFAFFCLPFIGQLPAIAETRLGVDTRSAEYGWFYSTFGFGALVGAVLVATVLLQVDKGFLVKAALLGFSISLATLSFVRSISVGYGVIFAVALFYFILPTVLATAWQAHVDSSVRGRVAAIWVLAFGGMVPLSNVVMGRIVESTSLQVVMLFGAGTAALLGLGFRLPSGPVINESIFADDSTA